MAEKFNSKQEKNFIKSLFSSNYDYLDKRHVTKPETSFSDKLLKTKSIFNNIKEGEPIPPLVKQKNKKKIGDSGKDWFNMKSHKMTEEAKNEFRILRLRNYIEPGRFYKRAPKKLELPDFFQIGSDKIHASQHFSNRNNAKKNFGEKIREDDETKKSIRERSKAIRDKLKKKKFYKKKNFKKKKKF
ncbi:Deoxynucleotidyltransferase terminal-interacting protein 2 [Bonamia ostreae]|uniref:Deoxynucleotidyltransferase terminal-interacting protein 2 n=1 Tax=Bonamia ostreae TaxID=126728 RepID=A0ABV2AH19_9EUKA